jgi:hypothetical protein
MFHLGAASSALMQVFKSMKARIVRNSFLMKFMMLSDEFKEG